MIFADLIVAMVADFSTLPALADVTVCGGQPLTNNPGTYLFVGIDNPDDERGVGARGTQTWPLASYTYWEDAGEIWMATYADNGDGDAHAALEAVAGAMEAVRDRIHANPTMGVPHVTRVEFSSYDYTPLSPGAAYCTFRLTFTART